MKKYAFAIILFFCFFSKCWSFNNFDLNITPKISLINGNIYEYVINPKCLNTDNILSKLDWEIKNVPCLELNATADVFRYLHAGFAFKFGIPCTSGNMQDYDWLNSIALLDSNVPNSWITDPADEITNYSKHENLLTDYYDVTIYIGGNIYITNSIVISPFAGWNYQFWAFDGMQGYKSYKWDSYAIKPLDGKNITYKQEINTLMLGFDSKLNFTPAFSIFAQFMICPAVSTNISLDYHYKTNTLFLDEFYGFLEIKATMGTDLMVQKNGRIGISFSIDYIPLTKGSDKSTTIDSNGNILTMGYWKKEAAFSGTQRFIWSAALSYNLYF